MFGHQPCPCGGVGFKESAPNSGSRIRAVRSEYMALPMKSAVLRMSQAKGLRVERVGVAEGREKKKEVPCACHRSDDCRNRRFSVPLEPYGNSTGISDS